MSEAFAKNFDKAFSEMISRKLRGFSKKGFLCNFVVFRLIRHIFYDYFRKIWKHIFFDK